MLSVDHTLSWQIVVAILITAPMAGRLLDAGLYHIYTPIIKEKLFSMAIKFDEITYVRMLHEDAKMARRSLETIFGRRRLSIQLALLSISSPILVLLIAIMMLGWDSIEAVDVYGFAILVPANVITDQLSLIATKRFLEKVECRLRSLLRYGLYDIVVISVLSPIPLAAAVAINDYFEGTGGSIFEYLLAWVAPWMVILALPVFPEFLREIRSGGTEDFAIVLSLGVILATATAPTVVHALFIARDIGLRIVIRPLAAFFANLFEYVSNERTPMTWICSAVGAIPAIVKAWGSI